MEDVPRVEAEHGADHHAHGRPVEQQPGQELDESPWTAVNWYRGEEAHASTLRRTGLDIQYQLRESGLMSEATRISAATLGKRLGPPPADSGQPTYRILADGIRAAVLDGRLAVATGLPSERDLATGLSLSRTTVGAAYALLRDQGWLDSRRGSGSRLRLPSGDGRSSARPGSPAREAPGPSFGAGGIFGWQDGVGWHHDAVGVGDPAQAMCVIDLTTACLPAPEEPLGAGRQAVV